ncbi:nucleotidyltransferase family protein [uncultured Cellulomonas sp.]|uniref:nucleotidyltransferase family protein n=1 Tax=uncultured Cellulomonas sp. TaxID=189682 RepID=UPI00260EE2B4|nr:nucleotidyltransferase family protein [uncultured Cellulomonas sp.]
MPDDDRTALHDGLRMTAVALARADIPYALVGGYAAWARGAPEPSHDADFVVREPDADRAKAALADAGLEVVQPAEDWLFKAYHDGAMVDVLFRMCGETIRDELFERSDSMEVLAVRMPVLEATDVLSAKMRVLAEHYCDLGRLLPVARALREQVDWPRLRAEVATNPYARALMYLLDELGISGDDAPATGG